MVEARIVATSTQRRCASVHSALPRVACTMAAADGRALTFVMRGCSLASPAMKTIKTIGHSNHPIERFVDLLKAGGVERLVDVRSMPWSRRFPQFGRERLANTLAEAGIDYAWEGEALGGKPRQGGGYDDLAARPEFKHAISRLIDGSTSTALCLMCAEKEPLDCHRI